MNVLFVTIAFFFVCVLAITMKTPHISRRFFTQIVLRKKILQALGIILFTALSVVLATAPPEETSSTTEVVAEWPASQPRVTASVPVESRVTKVVDGDTVKVETNGVQETVRIIGINTPETVDPRKPVECF